MQTKIEQVDDKDQKEEKVLHLRNREKKVLTFRLRKGQFGDEKGIIACIRDEYGDTYFKKDFYRTDYLRKEAASGNSTFLVAEVEKNEIAGMMVLKGFFPEETMCEITTQILKKKYRGYGLARPFLEFGMRILRNNSYSAVCCLPVLFHNITQRLLYPIGLRATGLMLNVFDVDKIIHSYENGKNHKHSQGIQIMALHKLDVGVIYLPKEHRAFAAGVYERLLVKYQIDTEEGKKQLPSGGKIQYQHNQEESSVEVRITSVGRDAIQHVRLLQSIYPLKGKQTFNILLNINDSNAVAAYRSFQEMGYFFTGFKCLCSENEYMILHHPGEVKVYLEDYVLSSEFAVIASYIKGCYIKRNGADRKKDMKDDISDSEKVIEKNSKNSREI